MLNIRTATADDLQTLLAIYRYAREFMRNTGNPDQWGTVHPAEEIIISDIHNGISKVICDENGIRGVFALLEEAEPTYAEIENGEWLNGDPYVTIHRIASDGQAHGIFRCAADHCKSVCRNVRIDTHKDNKIMRNLIEQNGFKKCGIIYVRDRSPRIAYHWTQRS